MYIERVPNRNSPPAVLLRSSHWDHGKIRKVTHANLSKLPQPLVDGIALLLHGGTVVGAGNTATVPAQVDKLRRRFGLSRVVLVGDRGMLTAARIREDLAPHEELGWISALRAPAIRRLLRERRFDPEQVGDWQLARIESPDYPGERLLVCRNPRLRRQRGRAEATRAHGARAVQDAQAFPGRARGRGPELGA